MWRLRHLLGCLLAPVGAAALPLVDNFDWLWSAGALAVMAAAFALPHAFAGRGDRFWVVAGRAVAVVAVADLVVSAMSGRQNILGAVIRVTLLLTVLRTMQPRRRREDMQLIVLSMFLAAVGGTLSLSPLFAAQVFVFIPLAGGVLFLINRFEDIPGRPAQDAHWDAFRWGGFLARLRAASGWRFAGFLAGAVGVVLVCGGVIFVVLPRFRMDRDMPFLDLPGSGKTGVSETMSLGAVNELTQDPAPAMRVDTPGRARPALVPYWRMQALDRYRSGSDESGFSLSGGAGRDTFFDAAGQGAVWSAKFPGAIAPQPLFATGEWVVHLEPNISRFLPAVGAVSRIRFDKTQEWRDSAALRLVRLDKVAATSLHMQMEVRGDLAAHAPPHAESVRLRELREASPRYPGTLLELPADPASRSALRATLADALGETPAADVEAAMRKIPAWLAAHHAYALRDGYAVRTARAGEPADYLVRWMRSGATGWCEHFAGACVLLAREAGHPARLVTGFYGGEWNESDSYLVVRMKHAHAWCEIFDRERGRWVRVDPTPAGGASASADTLEGRRAIGSFSGLSAWYDSMTMLWFRKVVNFEESDQREALKNAMNTAAAWRAALDSKLTSWRKSLSEAWSRRREAPGEALPALGLAVVTLALALLVRRFLLRLRRSRMLRGEASERLIREYRARAGSLLRRIDAADARGGAVPAGVRSAVERVRYGRPTEWGDAEAAFVEARRVLRGRGRKSAAPGGG